MLYNAEDIVGKTLFAKRAVDLSRSAGGNTVFTAKAGDALGVVYSWVTKESSDGMKLYWMFYDANKRPYYAKHETGAFDVNSLTQQGVTTTLEQIKAEKRDSETLPDKIGRWLGIGLLGFGVISLANSYIKTH